MRALRAILGGGLVAQAFRRPGVGTLLSGTLGLGLLARTASTGALPGLHRVGEPGESIRVGQSISIQAPIEEVYRTWTSYEHFPYFLRTVQEVKDLGGGRSAWTMAVAAPLAAHTRFTAVVTEERPNALFAWRTEEGQPVAHMGQLRFERTGERSTTVQAAMAFTPSTGAAGPLVASLFGPDPQRELDEGLGRMKAFMETGRAPETRAKSLL
jgi:uncharacterized membrane protein